MWIIDRRDVHKRIKEIIRKRGNVYGRKRNNASRNEYIGKRGKQAIQKIWKDLKY